MSRDFGRRLSGLGRAATAAGGNAVRAARDALNSVAKDVESLQPQIEARARAAVEAGGSIISRAGERLSERPGPIDTCPPEPERPSNFGDGAGTRAQNIAADAIRHLGHGTSRVGGRIHGIAPAFGSATGGALTGTARTISRLMDSITLRERDFDQLRRRLEVARLVVRAELLQESALITRAQLHDDRAVLLDMLVVGGVTLSTLSSTAGSSTDQIQQAFALAYPGLASGGETFVQAVDRLPTEDLVGLVNGVKGKLFELKLVEHMNHGGLPEGYGAELAVSATQPGYDLIIRDGDGHVADLLQAKATESAAYVLEALDRYPGIDVATTSEVYSQLMAMGVAENVIDSGLSEQLLEQQVEAAFASGHHLDAADLVPSATGLGIIALSSFMDRSLTIEERSRQFGTRAARTSITGAAAHATLIATNTWWLGLVVGVGSRWLTSHGGNRRQHYELLKDTVLKLEARAAAQGSLFAHVRQLPA